MRSAFPLVTSLTYCVVVCVSLVSFLLSLFNATYYELLSLHVSSLLPPFYVHQLITYPFVTREIMTFVLSTVSFILLARLIFRVWDKLEILFFLFIITALPALTLLGVFYATNLLGEPNDASSSNASGGLSVYAATTILYKQHDSERIIFRCGNTAFRSRHAPFLNMIALLVLRLMSLISPYSFLLFWMGFAYGWIYLRFFQRHPHSKFGDHRSSFAFAKFFPGLLERWVSLPSNLIYQLLLRTRICPCLERQSEIISTASFAANVPGIILSDADRHRRIALKALNERLSKSNSENAQPTTMEWPSLDEEVEQSKTELADDVGACVVSLPTEGGMEKPDEPTNA